MEKSLKMAGTFNLPNANHVSLIRVFNSLLSSNSNTPSKKSLAAFTLIELMVTLTVVCLLLVVAIPSFRTMLMNNRLTAATDSIVDALNYARNTALSESINVRVCPLGALNSTGCGGNWNSGWIVVTQPDTGTPVLLKNQQSAPNDPTLTTNVTSVLFDTHGLSTTQSNFKLCDSRGGSFARSIEVLATGFVQSGPTPGQAVWDNSALACP